ncbi:hypothetical protein [Arenibaculum pallidiluteum]|uniref:hypothetical protein n=1 Tax=Arenibaculum pallidiluteum TaxID=2812559 RepID=UPI001A96C3C5|nr:hypothetical protein [Arenibaculum pallidiluteum]
MIRNFWTAAAVVAACAALAGGSAAAQSGKQPPSCGAINFRPLENPSGDGDQQAGLYRSRFARIQVMAEVAGGQVRNYHMLLNGQRAGKAGGPVPSGAEACLRSKNVKVPVETAAAGQCAGSRFRVVTDRSVQPASAMLFALQGDVWKLCETAPLGSGAG